MNEYTTNEPSEQYSKFKTHSVYPVAKTTNEQNNYKMNDLSKEKTFIHFILFFHLFLCFMWMCFLCVYVCTRDNILINLSTLISKSNFGPKLSVMLFRMEKHNSHTYSHIHIIQKENDNNKNKNIQTC